MFAAMTSSGPIKHTPGAPVDLSSFLALGSLENIGATVLSGAPEGWVRFDLAGGDINAGLFAATEGRVRYVFPSTEHATILEGRATLTDENGVSATYGPGDTYFVRQGDVMTIVCEVLTIKSFFNHRR